MTKTAENNTSPDPSDATGNNFKCVSHSRFSQTHKIGNYGINTNFAFLCIYIFLLYLYNMIFVNIKLDINGYKSIRFQCWRHCFGCDIRNEQAKTKLTKLPFLCYGEFMKTSIHAWNIIWLVHKNHLKETEVSILSISIFFGRFLLICYPLKAKAVLTHRNVKIAILSIWVTSLITTLPLPIKFTYVATAHFEEVRLEQTQCFKSRNKS